MLRALYTHLTDASKYDRKMRAKLRYKMLNVC